MYHSQMRFTPAPQVIHHTFLPHVCACRSLPAAHSLMIYVSFLLHVCARALMIYVSFSDVLHTRPIHTSDTSYILTVCLRPPPACHRSLLTDLCIILTHVEPAQYTPPVIHQTHCYLPALISHILSEYPYSESYIILAACLFARRPLPAPHHWQHRPSMT